MRIRRRLLPAFAMMPFLAMWFGILGLFYFEALTRGELLFMLFPLLHLGVGLYLAWSTARRFNTVVLAFDGSVLVTREGPVPAPRTRLALPFDTIRGFEVTTRNLGRGRIEHRISGRTTAGAAILLPMMFDDGAHAIFAQERLKELLVEARTRRAPSLAVYRD